MTFGFSHELSWPNLPAFGFSRGPALVVDDTRSAGVVGSCVQQDYEGGQHRGMYMVTHRMTPEILRAAGVE